MNFIFDPGLALYLPLYKLDGGSFVSKDACGHSCTVIGATWESRGRYFDGSDDYLYKSISGFRNNDTTGTICAWIKTTRSSTQRIFMSSDEGSNVWYFGVGTTPQLTAQASKGGTNNYVRGQTSLNDGNWHFVCVTGDGSVWTFNVDGADEAATVVGGNNEGDWFADVSNRDNFSVGAMIRQTGNPNNPFSGTIGSISIYNRALSLVEKQSIFLATKWRYQ